LTFGRPKRRAGVPVLPALLIYCMLTVSPGVFAAQYILAHTFIGVYSGEILTDIEGGERSE
jgi:hypothetical protein